MKTILKTICDIGGHIMPPYRERFIEMLIGSSEYLHKFEWEVAQTNSQNQISAGVRCTEDNIAYFSRRAAPEEHMLRMLVDEVVACLDVEFYALIAATAGGSFDARGTAMSTYVLKEMLQAADNREKASQEFLMNHDMWELITHEMIERTCSGSMTRSDTDPGWGKCIYQNRPLYPLTFVGPEDPALLLNPSVIKLVFAPEFTLEWSPAEEALWLTCDINVVCLSASKVVCGINAAISDAPITERYPWNMNHVAAKLGVNRNTIGNWMKKGDFPHMRLGGRIMFNPDEVQAYVRENIVQLKGHRQNEGP